jgi:hypothetical protein
VIVAEREGANVSESQPGERRSSAATNNLRFRQLQKQSIYNTWRLDAERVSVLRDDIQPASFPLLSVILFEHLLRHEIVLISNFSLSFTTLHLLSLLAVENVI